MSTFLPRPDERVLRDFLLGTLAPDLAEQVAAWLASEPSADASLQRLAADDLLTSVLADLRKESPSTAAPRPEEERTIRSVLEALGTANTPAPGVLTTPPVDAGAGPAAPLPSHLGGYRVLRELGRGGMGLVLEAEDDQLQRRVAIKVMAPERATSPHTRARFLREARAAAAIEHENVVPLFHVGDEGGVPFLVMPLLRGESLESRLRREGPLAPAEVVRIGREAAAGLAAAHTRGLVHRDVKPANIWLEAPQGEPGTSATGGRVKILDFGLARTADAADGLTAPGAILGTPAFMAPELVDGQPADARSDLFSLGATLYCCATGKQPFAGPTLTAILRAVATHYPPPPHEIEPAVGRPLSDLIVRLLAKDPAARPQSAREVADELTGLGEQPLTTAWHSPAPSAGRRWWALSFAVAAVVLLATASGWLLTHLPGIFRTASSSPGPQSAVPGPAVHYHGSVTVLVERTDPDGQVRLLRLNEPGALPLRKTDKFRVEGNVKPAAYLYVVWVDPGHDVTPVYPWDARVGWGSRKALEEPVSRVSLPPSAGNRYTAPDAKPGVATMVLFARPTPLDVPDEVVRGWFESLPDLPLPAGGEQAAVWFDDYVEVKDPDRSRTFGEVGSDDAFARWQGQLQKVLGDQAAFQTAASFARTGGK
jgi:serine/threonine protein kinase